MKKLLWAVIISLLFISNNTFTPSIQVNAQEDGIPSYAKWGRLAMQETKERYSSAEIIDYLHIGKESKGENSVEKFKLWLKEDDREFGVYIDITFHTQTEEVISINFEETDR